MLLTQEELFIVFEKAKFQADHDELDRLIQTSDLQNVDEKTLIRIFDLFTQRVNVFLPELKALSFYLSESAFLRQLNAFYLYTPNVQEEAPLRQWMALFDYKTFHPILEHYFHDPKHVAKIFKNMLYGAHPEDLQAFFQHEKIISLLKQEDFIKELLWYCIHHNNKEMGLMTIQMAQIDFSFDYQRISHPYLPENYEYLWQAIESKKMFNSLQNLPKKSSSHKIKI